MSPILFEVLKSYNFLLKASISPARHMIARRVGLNLLEYKKWGVPEELVVSYIHNEIEEC